jgi:hypothetical protein
MAIETTRHIGVPYYSQWGSPDWVRAIVEEAADPCDDPHWRQSGFAEPEGNADQWTNFRSCRRDGFKFSG